MKPESGNLILWFVFIFIIASCNETMPEKNAGYKAEIENRKIVRVTNGELMQYASQLGKKMADTLLHTNDSLLLNKITSSYNFLISTKTSGNIDSLSKEYRIYDAYLYNLENGLPLEDNMQQTNDEFLYTRPLIENKKLSGIWTITMSKKELIKKYSLKDNLRLII